MEVPQHVTLEEKDGVLFIGLETGKQEIWHLEETHLRKMEGAQKWKLFRSTASDESLLITDKTIVNYLQTQNSGWWKRQKIRGGNENKTIYVLLGSLLTGVLLVILFFWKGMPILADIVATHVPASWEKDLGHKISEQVLAESQIDSSKTEKIRRLYGRLIELESTSSQIPPIEIFVLRKNEFNAFAIPGRKIFIYDGALKKIKTYPQLLALIGHEAGHVEKRHSVRTLFRSLSTYAVFSFFFGDLTGLAGVIAENAGSLQNLSYSRDFEREADLAAHQFLCLNEIDQNGIPELMEIMQKDDKGSGSEIPGFLSSHPLTSERLENAKAQMKTHPCRSGGEDASLQSLFNDLQK